VPACDRRTDVQPVSITCFSIADARKNAYFRLRLHSAYQTVLFQKSIVTSLCMKSQDPGEMRLGKKLWISLSEIIMFKEMATRPNENYNVSGGMKKNLF